MAKWLQNSPVPRRRPATDASYSSTFIENLESEKADLHPVDESKIYNIVPWQFAEHQTIKHSADEYARYPESKPVVTHE